jgi:hypothetical protein
MLRRQREHVTQCFWSVRLEGMGKLGLLGMKRDM